MILMIFMKYLSDIDFKVFINLYKKWTEKLYSFLIIDTTFASVNPLSFTKKFQKEYKKSKWQLMIRLEMTTLRMK